MGFALITFATVQTARLDHAKKALAAARGWVPVSTTSTPDDHKAYYPYVMNYDWVTAMWRGDDGVARGFNLTRNQCVEPDRWNENCAWVGDQVWALPPVTFTRADVRGPTEAWQIRDAAGAFVAQRDNDPGLGFEWKPPGLITYRHKSATLDLAVHFTDDLGDDRSDAALLAHFAGFSGSIPFPADIVADTPGDVLNAFYSPVGSLEDRLQFTTLAFAEGRLQATWHGELSAAIQRVHSDEETCTDADIAGQCDCIYAPAPFPVDLELDLSIDD